MNKTIENEAVDEAVEETFSRYTDAISKKRLTVTESFKCSRGFKAYTALLKAVEDSDDDRRLAITEKFADDIDVFKSHFNADISKINKYDRIVLSILSGMDCALVSPELVTDINSDIPIDSRVKSLVYDFNRLLALSTVFPAIKCRNLKYGANSESLAYILAHSTRKVTMNGASMIGSNDVRKECAKFLHSSLVHSDANTFTHYNDTVLKKLVLYKLDKKSGKAVKLTAEVIDED